MQLTNDNTCGWINQLSKRTVIKGLNENCKCDFLIIGAGYTGLSAARKLSEIEPNKLLSANFIATVGLLPDEITLYFVPRDKNKQFWNGNRGIVGGLEVLGELVMASEDELALVESGMLDYHFIEKALSTVSMN